MKIVYLRRGRIDNNQLRKEKCLKYLLNNNLVNDCNRTLYEILIERLNADDEFYKIREFYDVLLDIFKKIPVYYDNKSNVQRYLYGEINTINGQMILGVRQLPKVSLIYDIIISLKRHYDEKSKEIIKEIFKRENTHWEYLGEMDPLVRTKCLENVICVDYEVSPFDKIEKTIDWFIETNKTKYLIEVKTRLKPLLESMVNPNNPQPADANGIFRSCEDKFDNKDNDHIKILWIVTDIEYNHSSLMNEINRLDDDKIDVMIITNILCPVSIYYRNINDYNAIINELKLNVKESIQI